MTRDEVKTIMRAIATYYDTFQVSSEKIDAWHLMLSDYDYNVILASLKSFVTSNASQFAPSIGQLVNGAYDLAMTNEPSEGELWSIYRKGIGDSAHHSVERFNEFPEILKRVAGSPQALKELNHEDFNEQVEQGIFLKKLRAERERERKTAIVPNDVKQIVQDTVAKLEHKEVGQSPHG